MNGVIVILILAFFTYRILVKKKLEQHSAPIVSKKVCPPHDWYWQELKDATGEVQGHRLVCKNCGPLSKLLGYGDV